MERQSLADRRNMYEESFEIICLEQDIRGLANELKSKRLYLEKLKHNYNLRLNKK